MGTIITHGKVSWNRANKNKRIDADLEAEQKNRERTLSGTVVKHTDVIQMVMEVIEPGQTIITKVNDSGDVSVLTPNVSLNKHTEIQSFPKLHKREKPIINKPIENLLVEETREKVILEPVENKHAVIDVVEKKIEIKKTRKKSKNKQGVQFIEDIIDLEEKLRLLNS